MGYTIEVESEEGFGWEHFARTKDMAITLAECEEKDGNAATILDADGEVVEWK